MIEWIASLSIYPYSIGAGARGDRVIIKSPLPWERLPAAMIDPFRRAFISSPCGRGQGRGIFWWPPGCGR